MLDYMLLVASLNEMTPMFIYNILLLHYYLKLVLIYRTCNRYNYR